MSLVSERLGVPLIEVYRVANFYKAFSLSPRGRHLITVCMGTACHVRPGAYMDRSLLEGNPHAVLEGMIIGAYAIGAGVCRALIHYTIDTDKCTGCGACLTACPHDAITGEKKEPHTISAEVCTKCGICRETCKFDAVTVL